MTCMMLLTGWPPDWVQLFMPWPTLPYYISRLFDTPGCKAVSHFGFWSAFVKPISCLTFVQTSSIKWLLITWFTLSLILCCRSTFSRTTPKSYCVHWWQQPHTLMRNESSTLSAWTWLNSMAAPRILPVDCGTLALWWSVSSLPNQDQAEQNQQLNNTGLTVLLYLMTPFMSAFISSYLNSDWMWEFSALYEDLVRRHWDFEIYCWLFVWENVRFRVNQFVNLYMLVPRSWD